jgi:hypothetical protein
MFNQNRKEMDANLQIKLAKEAGMVNRTGYEGRSWEQEYKYHLGMVENPHPFELFKLKFNRLNDMFESDPEGKNKAYDKPILNLCNALGY